MSLARASLQRRRRQASSREARIVLPSPLHQPRQWVLAPPHPERHALASALGVGELSAQCLLNRGVTDESAGNAFLRAGLSALLRPEDLPDAAAAVARIRRAIKDGETICVWGDYDVDGVSGTA